MKCEDVRAAFLEGIDGEPELTHLHSCPACRSQLADLESARSVLASSELWEEPSPELEEQIVTLIRARRGTQTPYRRRIRTAFAIAASVLVVVIASALLMSRPDWKIDLVATSPGTAASVAGWNTSAGTRVALRSSGLEPAPTGYVYELWFSDQGTHVSAGTFTDASDVHLVVGVARRDYPHIWVTLEPLDGNPAPSSQVILDTQA